MRPARFWTGVLVGLAACLGSAVPARAQEPADECCALPGPAPAAVGWWQRFLVVQKAEAAQQPAAVTQAYKCVHVPAGEAQRMLVQLLGGDGQKGAKGGRLALVADERTNTLFVRGSAEQVAEARDLLSRIDAVAKGLVPDAGAPFFEVYAVPAGQAEHLAKLLQRIHQDVKGMVIGAVAPNRIAVWANSEKHLAVARAMQAIAPPAVTEIIPLTELDATQTARILAGQGTEPLIEPEPARNALLVKGTREQINEVRRVLRELGEPGQAQGGAMRVIPVPSGSAADLAEYLKGMLEKMRANPVRLIVPGRPEAKPAKSAPAPAKGGAKLTGRANMPITIAVAGAKLVLTCEDPEALKLAQELLGLITRRHEPSDRNFEVIPLRSGKADAAARTLDEVFNGAAGGEGKPGLGGKAGLPRREDRVRIVADPSTNTLLVRASPMDLLTIRRLLARSLDSADTALSESQMRTWVIGSLKYAKAAELAKVVQEVYRPESTRSTEAARSRPALTVGVDERANTLVLRCSQPLYEEIRRLVEQLEQMHRDKK